MTLNKCRLRVRQRIKSKSEQNTGSEIRGASEGNANGFMRHMPPNQKKTGRTTAAPLEVILAGSSSKAASPTILVDEGVYRAYFERSMDAMLLMASGGRILAVNSAACELFGRTEMEIAQASCRGLLGGSSVSLKKLLAKHARSRNVRGELEFLRGDGSQFPGEIIAVHCQGASNEALSVVVIREITDRRRAEKEAAKAVKQWECAMQGTLLAISNMVEHSDPYTAGHQRRVGIIAADIARELGWPNCRCNELRNVGLVHDIGKMAIPTDLLVKATPLTIQEIEIIKTHALKGYEILKDVAFPYPIAEIVYQHHERIDGSGYPRGLKGDEILPEARILAVADSLEAMATDRPYRASLGLEMALNEIERGRGTAYDPDPVDACLRLFRENGYKMPD
ncbi:MAG: HD domain-containing protein [Fimbriimonas sp.]|nr:HD domain-containing protein [Fimbriimonas sp.]